MKNAVQKHQNTRPAYDLGTTVDSIFNNTLRRFFDGNFWDSGSLSNGMHAPVNVRETDNRYELDLIAPGCRKEDFRITVQDKQLTISLEHQDERKEENEKAGWVRNEYMQRSFSRSFTMDETIDVEKIDATYQDGILRLVLPKNEKAKPDLRSIEIK